MCCVVCQVFLPRQTPSDCSRAFGTDTLFFRVEVFYICREFQQSKSEVGWRRGGYIQSLSESFRGHGACATSSSAGRHWTRRAMHPDVTRISCHITHTHTHTKPHTRTRHAVSEISANTPSHPAVPRTHDPAPTAIQMHTPILQLFTYPRIAGRKRTRVRR